MSPVPASIGPDQKALLDQLVDAFLAENSIHNLSAFRTKEACWTGNVEDSLAALNIPEFAQLPAGAKCMDVGTGGGFPLLPLAAVLPQMEFHGLDSIQKKIDAIGRIIKTINLQNVHLHCGRTEEFGRDANYRECFDVVTARAVAELPVLLEYCSPFCKPGGYMLLWKSVKIDEELQSSLLARAELGCHLVRSHEYDLGESWGQRQILIFQKRTPLSTKYPREVGVPKAKPIV